MEAQEEQQPTEMSLSSLNESSPKLPPKSPEIKLDTKSPPTEEKAPSIELPSIGSVTGIKSSSGIGVGGGSGIGKVGQVPSINTTNRPNIIQLPGNILGAKGNNPQTSHPGYAMPPGGRNPLSPPYIPNVPPQGYPHVIMSPNQQPGYHGMPPGPPPPPPPSGQKMELHDAFAYLDRVKAEFSEHPEVYNRFLQIMREFKANSIDANGVIVRVVQLFKGHKALIQGFNAFLPRSHHIDPIVAETGILPPHLMQVASSMGIPVNQQGIPMSLPSMVQQNVQYSQQWNDSSAQPPQQNYQSGYSAPNFPIRPPITSMQPPPSQPPLSSVPVISTPVGGVSAQTSKRSSAQFVRAISYVKKIKHRFANDPEVYKTFLAALHSYHKEQKTIFEVYMDVANLFADHQDLLEEFVLFLPENEAISITSRLSQTGAPPPITAATAAISASTAEPKSNAVTKRPTQISLPPSRSSKRSRLAASYGIRTAEESAFYERVKRYLGDKHAYAEFLKCLNLFCQDIIKIQDLVQLVRRFIGQNEELFSWFKKYIGFKDEPGETGPVMRLNDTRVNENGELNLQSCKKIGSYRIYPRSHILPKSSQRTDLGKETLNDVMVSCPVFNSEDSTFIASKKNQYEEALFRCEDERFEMDLLIEHNLSAIAVLEPLARKIDFMSSAEKDSWTLGLTLGGSSVSIYKKAIKRIYGDKADEVILGLQKNPAVAIPVVLRRLKQKDEEWRKVQRDWNKIWRDVHVKNYYKALDHQGVEFKTNDRRNITGRNMIMEIENIANERRRGIERGESYASHHLEYNCGNASGTAEDLIKIVRSYVKHAPSFSGNDRKGVIKFLESFLPGLFAFINRPLSDQVVSKAKAAYIDEPSSSSSEYEGPEAFEHGTEKPHNRDLPNLPPPSPSIPILLFANNNLYVLTRLLQMSMERLEKLRVAATIADSSPFIAEKKNVVASFLDVQAQTHSSEDMRGDLYVTLLILLRKLVCGDIEPSVFEERVRFMFGTAAYPIFTFDKVIQTLVKQIQIILTDHSSEQLIRLFDSWNARKISMRLSEYSARMAVESTVQGKENIYRIEYLPLVGKLTIQLLDRLGENGSNTASAEARWSSYVDNFVKLENNLKYLDPSKRVYLKRNLKRVPSVDPKTLKVQYNLECKIAVNTYKLFYVENTEDFLLRLPRRLHYSHSVAQSRFHSWLNENIKDRYDNVMEP